MRRRVVLAFGVAAIAIGLLGVSAAAASAVPARYQLRGHLPDLGERPTIRVFLTQAAYDSYRNSLGDANIFPPVSSLFMTFDKDILALYTRGNDVGGRCIATAVVANWSGDTTTATLDWQSGTCGAPSTAHYPFILLSISRTASDGTAWLSSSRQVCALVQTADTNACAALTAASPAPSATASATPAATPTPATATRSLTPTQTVAIPSPTASAAATASRSPAAAASPSAPADDPGTNYLLYAMLVAIAFLVLLSLFLSRGSSRRGR